MRKAFTKKKLLYIVMGFLLASTGYLYLEYQYEKKTLNAVIASVYQTPGLDPNSEEQVALAAMQLTHNMMNEQHYSAMGLQLNGLERLITSPLQQFALTKDGACGGNSLVLAQVLKGMGFAVRPGQMVVNGSSGGHIVLEVKINNRWAVLDPLYNLSFKMADGRLASFSDVSGNWNYYKSQAPAHYDPNYDYDGVEYTNWSKIPVLGAACKGVLSLFMGREGVNQFSARSLFLNPKKILFFVSLFLLGLSIISILNYKYFHISLPRLLLLKKLRPAGAPMKPVLNMQ